MPITGNTLATKNQKDKMIGVIEIKIRIKPSKCLTKTVKNLPGRIEYQWKGDLDLLNIVMVGLPKKLPAREEKYELHRLLYALFSSSLPVTKRLEIVQEECPTQREVTLWHGARQFNYF